VQIIHHLLRFVSRALKRWPLQAVGGALMVVSMWVVMYTYESSERVVFQYAKESAQEHAESVTQFRNFYAQELVPRAMKAGVAVTHDYKSRDNALPLPATLTIELGHYISQVDGGTQVRLYSDLPFPWRAGERALDDFQTQALAHLKTTPSQPFVREEMMHGQRVLRYAQADRMLSGCVACHNHYPGSPKTDWQVGDVRGALEVVLPVSQWQSATTNVLTRTFTVLLVVVLGGLLLVWLSVRRIRAALMVARDLSSQRQDAIQQLNQEISERQLVEQELRLSESKLNSIFASVPEAIVVADPDGRIVRTWKTRLPKDYLNPAKPFKAGEKTLGNDELPFEFLMNALRLTAGVESRLYPERTGLPLESLDEHRREAEQSGLLQVEPSRLAATARGQLFLNDLLQYFLI